MPVINEGTQTTIHTVTNAGTQIQVIKLDIGAGTSLSDFGGTILAVNNLTDGTVRISVGTITTGTLQNLVSGTVNALAAGTITGGTLTNLATGTITRLEGGTVVSDTELPAAAALSDSISNPTTPIIGDANLKWDPQQSIWIRETQNYRLNYWTSNTLTDNGTGADTTNSNSRGAIFYLDITASAGTTPTFDCKFQGKDLTSGKYFDIPGAAFAQKGTIGQDTLTIYPGIAETANVSVSDVIPSQFRNIITIGGSGPSFTFSLGIAFIV